MSQSNYGSSKGYVATAAIAGEGYAVKLSSGNVVVATAGTDKILGVTENSVAAGEVASVKLRSGTGTIKVKAGGTVAVGDALTATTGGKLIATTTAGDQIVGYAVEAGVANDLIEATASTAKY